MLLEWHRPMVVEEPQAKLGAASSKSDPGPATDYKLSGPLYIRKHRVLDRAEYDAFLQAIRSQGDEGIRHGAISLLLERARQDRRVDARAYRVLSQVCSRARWRHRYHFEALALTAHFTAGDASNLHRDIKQLVDEKHQYLARVRIRREGGGKPVSYLTPICTAQDRSGETRTILDKAARASTGEQPIRQDDELQNVTLTDCEAAKPSLRRVAIRHHDEHIVDSHWREKKEFEFVDGRLRLFGGEREGWEEKFGGAEALDGALTEVAGYLKPHDGLAQVRSRLQTNLRMSRDGARRAQPRPTQVASHRSQPSRCSVGGGVRDTNEPFEQYRARMVREGHLKPPANDGEATAHYGRIPGIHRKGD